MGASGPRGCASRVGESRAAHASPVATPTPFLMPDEAKRLAMPREIAHIRRLVPELEQVLFSRPAISRYLNERSTTMEATSIIMAALGLLILLAVTSIRFGVDSREELSTDDRHRTSWGSR